MANILIAEDDPDLRMLLCLLMQKQGHTTVDVPNGVQALQLIRSGEFDLVLLDNMMPEVSGVEVLENMWDLYGEDRPLVMVVSALKRYAVSYFENGADDFIAKPFSATALVSKVDTLLAMA